MRKCIVCNEREVKGKVLYCSITCAIYDGAMSVKNIEDKYLLTEKELEERLIESLDLKDGEKHSSYKNMGYGEKEL